MSAFTHAEIDADGLTWNLFQNGGVVLFRRHDLLQSTIDHLIAAEYRAVVIECVRSSNIEDLCREIVISLGIEPYERLTLDGFNDFISQIEFEGAKGVVVALVNFMDAWRRDPTCALAVADILADQHRRHLLMGDRLLTLLQCDEPDMNHVMGRIGGYLPVWNSAEWFDADRSGPIS